MPRNSHRERVDDGDDGVSGPPSRLQNVAAAQKAQVAAKRKKIAAGKASSSNTKSNNTTNNSDDQDLEHLEQRLNDEVDEDLFEEPRRFQTLPRVIDVLGVQMIDDATQANNTSNMGQNPAYQQLKTQQTVVEAAIEHMAVIHCANLNASVISVGRVARQFSDAVDKVRQLRKQVRDIQDSLGPTNNNNNTANNNSNKAMANPNEPASGAGNNAAAMSLRELWLKKLECEATLSLLDKLDVIRAAPARFDEYMKKSRIGAAVLAVSQALETMFRNDVAQVQALHKIMEQLMIRKQTAEEIVWDTLMDVLFLRTGNGLKTTSVLQSRMLRSSAAAAATSSDDYVSGNASVTAHSVSSESRHRSSVAGGTATATTAATTTNPSTTTSTGGTTAVVANGMVNPFLSQIFRFATVVDGTPMGQEGDDDDTVASDQSHASLFSIEGEVDAAATTGDDEKSKTAASSKTTAASTKKRRLLIPIPMIEAELDLENDERRVQEEIALSGMATQSSLTHNRFGGAMTSASTAGGGSATAGRPQPHHHRWALPRYGDHVLGLRILVECVAFLKRMDDVERHVAEQVAAEIRFLVQQEQARTFARMEQQQQQQASSSVHHHSRVATVSGDPVQVSMREFRRHLTGLLSAFGSVLLRLSHLAQILRFRIVRTTKT